MNSMNLIVARNIKRLREEKKLSMDELAKLSGVSKSMLAQVERGEGNPTLSTLWKLSNGMKVPFNALTVSPKAPYEVVRTAEMQPILEDGGKVKNYCLFPDDENRKFSVYYMELAPGSHWQSEPHLRGTPSLSPFSPVQSKSRLIRRPLSFRRAKASAFRATPPTPTATSLTKPLFCT